MSRKTVLPPELVEECRQRYYAGEGYRDLQRWLLAEHGIRVSHMTVRALIMRPGPTIIEMGWCWDPSMIRRCLADWEVWGLLRHHHYLPADSIARAVVDVVSAPRGTHLSLVEVNPEAPIEPAATAEPAEPAASEPVAATDEESS